MNTFRQLIENIAAMTPKPMNQPDYTAATGDILTAATLAKPEAKKAAVKAVIESYFPATGETISPTIGGRNHILLIRNDGQVEEWEGSTFRASYLDLADAAKEIQARP